MLIHWWLLWSPVVQIVQVVATDLIMISFCETLIGMFDISWLIGEILCNLIDVLFGAKVGGL